jgi:hypothetical protein
MDDDNSDDDIQFLGMISSSHPYVKELKGIFTPYIDEVTNKIRQHRAPPSIISYPPWVIYPNKFPFGMLVDGRKWTSPDWQETYALCPRSRNDCCKDC